MRKSHLLALLVSLAACGHDARRENPFDPDLTPAVGLSAVADDDLGTARLTWSAYVGRMPFRAYVVWRNVAGLERTERLAEITDAADTTFTDTRREPDTTYEYRVAITNREGFSVVSEPRTVTAYTVEGVQLLVADPDPRTGGISLRWRRYRGPGFEGYAVERRVRDRIGETIITRRTSLDDTVYVDPQPMADVDYLYRVITTAAGRALLSNTIGRALFLPAVVLDELILTSTSATATLRWLAYEGPRFQAYRIWRRSRDLPPDLIASISSATSTTYTDTGLKGNIDYRYRVDVVTEREETAVGIEHGGRFHGLTGQWPLAIDAGGRVRLYSMGDTLFALVATQERIRLYRFTGGGDAVSPPLELSQVGHIVPGSASLARGPEGILLISIARDVPSRMLAEPVPAQTLLFALQADTLVRRAVDLFTAERVDHVASSFSGITIRGLGVGYSYEVPPLPSSIALFRGPTLIDDTGPAAASYPLWDFTSSVADVPSFLFQRDTGALAPDRLRVDLSLGSSFGVRTTSVAVAGELARGGALEVQLSGAGAVLRQVAPDGSSAEHSETVEILHGFSTRFQLSALDGSVSLGFADLWHETVSPAPSSLSLLTAGGSLFFARDGTLRLFDSADLVAGDASPEDLSYLDLSGIVSEMRQWARRAPPGTEGRRLGVCLPQQHQVRIGSLRILQGGASLADLEELEIGDHPAATAGQFVVPLSFAVGPDERIFVLDAGNGRIQVFDPVGAYITQLGRPGDGDGEFDFLGGPHVTDFAGSIAVDDQGFIYVADVGNQRIQVFAP